MITSLHQDVIDAAYRPRQHLLSDAAPAANSLVQVSAGSVRFQRAFFYGVKSVPADGRAPTGNAGSVFIGEKDRPSGNVYCLDEVTNDPGAPVKVETVAGTALDLADFYVFCPNAGDRVFVRYE